MDERVFRLNYGLTLLAVIKPFGENRRTA